MAYIEHIAPTNPLQEKYVFTISPILMQQCIDMVAKEQDYIPFPDGIEADYSVYNIPGEGVWIVEPWATEGGDYTKIQEIIIIPE